MATSDEWYDDWLTRLNRRFGRDRGFRQRLERERRGVQLEVAMSPERAYDEKTEQLRRALRTSLTT